MSIKKFPEHYAMTSPASVYDEEALTALELAGRTAAKLNEIIDQSNHTLDVVEDWNGRMDEEITKAAKTQVEKYMNDGAFDEAIDRYAGNLDARLDNLAGSMTEGSTTMDVEVIDTRVAYDGRTYDSAGAAVRAQVGAVNAATNDRLSATAMECGYKCDYNRVTMWEQGWIDGTGVEGNTGVDNERFIRTRDFIPDYVERIETVGGAADGIRLRIFVYTHGGDFLRREEHQTPTYTFDHARYKYKVAATGGVGYYFDAPNLNGYDSAKTDITPDDAVNILMLGKADTNNGIVSADASRYGYHVDHNARHLWEQGYIFSADGENGVDPTGWDYWFYNRLVGYVPDTVDCVGVAPGFKGRLFIYTKNGAFMECREFTLMSDTLDHATYNYRVDFTTHPSTEGVYNYTNDAWRNVYLLGAGTAKSPYIKDVYIAPAPGEYYSCTGDTAAGLNASTSADTIYSKIHNAATWYTAQLNYRVEDIGTATDGSAIKAYRFSTPLSEGSVDLPRPKVIIIAGQHGFEKGNVFGLYHFIYDLTHSWTTSPTLSYIRGNVELIVVPIANPYGFDHDTYKNGNQVNLNRNYPHNWERVASTESDQYGGAAAFDQPETQAIRDLIKNEDNVALVIDSHSMGSGAVANNKQLNWVCCCARNEAGYMRMANVARAHLNNMTNYIRINYPTTMSGGAIGYFTGFQGGDDGVASLDNWVTYDLDTIGVTLEGFNAFPGGTLHAIDAQRANAEIIGNFILAFCREYERN